MNVRTNFDLILKDSGKTYLTSRGRDCFGEYTNSGSLMSRHKNHIVMYYIPEYFTRIVLTDSGGYKRFKDETYKDKILITEDQISEYISWLVELGVNVERLEDVELKDAHAKYPSDLPKTTKNMVLKIDLSTCKNAKDAKISLFLCRYIVNCVGGAILKNMFNILEKYPEISKWDAFLLSEFIFNIVHSQFDYIIFGGRGIFRYFTWEEFREKAITSSNNFNYIDDYVRSDIFPYRILMEMVDGAYLDTPQRRAEKISLTTSSRKDLKSKFVELSTPEFLEYWKNYNW